MSCYGCSRKYGFFCKEHGCPNCGYSYCAKCLRRPIAVPRHGGSVLDVCLICYDKLKKLQTISDAEKMIDVEPLPGELLNRSYPRNAQAHEPEATDALFENVPASVDLAAVLEPSSQAQLSTEPSTSRGSADIDENLDNAISKRLQNLKSVETTDDDIRARLSELTGMPLQKNYDKKDLLLSTDQRTDQQKMNDLLEQFAGETALDQRVGSERQDAISDIERRLRILRDTPIEGVSGSGGYTNSDANTPSDNEADENDEATLKKIIDQYVAEAKLPSSSSLNDELGPPPSASGAPAAQTEELPWCCICNEDAVYRCRGCDGDLFCRSCFHECHDNDEDFSTHAKDNYSAPPKLKEDHF